MISRMSPMLEMSQQAIDQNRRLCCLWLRLRDCGLRSQVSREGGKLEGFTVGSSPTGQNLPRNLEQEHKPRTRSMLTEFPHDNFPHLPWKEDNGEEATV